MAPLAEWQARMLALRSGEGSWRRGSNVFPVLASGARFGLIAGWEQAEVHPLANRRAMPARGNESVPVALREPAGLLKLHIVLASSDEPSRHQEFMVVET